MRDRLTRLGYTAATLAAIDGIAGLPAHVPFDRIIATPTRHTIWFTDPDGPIWPLPVGRETSVSEEQSDGVSG